jgi:hypothetical protein
MPFVLAIPPLRIYSIETFLHIWKDLGTRLFVAVLLVIGNKV